MAFVGGYLVVYVVGRSLLRVLHGAEVPDLVSAALVVGLTAPLSFLVGRLTLGRPRPGVPDALEVPVAQTEEGARP